MTMSLVMVVGVVALVRLGMIQPVIELVMVVMECSLTSMAQTLLMLVEEEEVVIAVSHCLLDKAVLAVVA